MSTSQKRRMIFVCLLVFLLTFFDLLKGKLINDICYWPPRILFQLTGSQEIHSHGHFSGLKHLAKLIPGLGDFFYLAGFETLTYLVNLLFKEDNSASGDHQ